MKETDLIYEGIATVCGFVDVTTAVFEKETDLIYEGIATYASGFIPPSGLGKETDLIYEGIATCLLLCLV